VFFSVILPWTRPGRMEAPSETLGQRSSLAAFLALSLTLMAAAVLLARRNLRMGRGDRRGANWVAGFVFFSIMAIPSVHHVPTRDEVWITFNGIGWGLLWASGTWLGYLALEPYARKLWPHALVSWSRLLAGRLRDPLVGRDLLVGTFAAVICYISSGLYSLAISWSGGVPTRPNPNALLVLEGIGESQVAFANAFIVALITAVGLLLLILLLQLLLRRTWLVGTAFVSIIAGLITLGGSSPAFAWPLPVLAYALVFFVALRFGLLATIALNLSVNLLQFFPHTLDLYAWYAPVTLIALLALLALAVFGFSSARSGRRVIGDSVFER